MWVIQIQCDPHPRHLGLQEAQLLFREQVLEVLQVVDGLRPQDGVVALHPLVDGVDEHVDELVPQPEVRVADVLAADEKGVNDVHPGDAAHRAELAAHLLDDLGVKQGP